MTAENTLDILVVEDNPGDLRLIEEMLRETDGILQRFDSGERFADGTKLHHEETLASGIARTTEVDVDVILLDLGLPDSTGLPTLTTVLDATEFVPIVVLTGLSDGEIGIKAIQQGAQDYLVKGQVTSDLLVRSIHYALERNRQERERARRREQLEALNRLNEISQDVTHTVITTSTREDLERAVCERLVDSDAYRFAWIGEVSGGSDEVVPRVAAGVEDGYLDSVTVTSDDTATSRGPAGTAIRTRDVQVIQNARTDPAFEPWRDEALERNYQSVASVPIQYEEILYGVLNIYASSPNAFPPSETEILSRLGDVIGHAITAIERKEALVSDTVLELEFRVEDIGNELRELTAEGTNQVLVESFVRTGKTVLVYGRVVGIPQDSFREAAERLEFVEEVRILSAGERTYKFEAVTGAINSLVDEIGNHGGRISSGTISDGDLQFVVEFPPGRDKRQLIELVEEQCPNAANRAQRLVDRTSDTTAWNRFLFLDSLTEKQRIALQTAYFGGLFEWPRGSTGQELADRLDISPPTFSQHLRDAERKIFEELFTGAVSD